MVFEQMVEEIRNSKLFDEAWYLMTYPEVVDAPIGHYLIVGAREGKNPSPYFDTAYYLKAYPEVAKARYNPLLHYIRVGQQEGYSPCPSRLAIVIPHKNSVGMLPRLLKSIERETTEVEVFVVDDHSDSKELARLETLKKSFPAYDFLSNEGRFAGVARNTALKRVKSQWVLFADADDYFLPGWYDEVSKHFKCREDVVYFPPTSEDLLTGKVGVRHLGYEEIVHDYLKLPRWNEDRIRVYMYPPWSKLVRMDFLRKHGIWFGEEMVANDVMFSLRTGFFAERITASQVPIYCATEGLPSLVAFNTLERLKIRADVDRQFNDFLAENYQGPFNLRKKCNYLQRTAIYSGFSEEEMAELLVYIHRLGLEI